MIAPTPLWATRPEAAAVALVVAGAVVAGVVVAGAVVVGAVVARVVVVLAVVREVTVVLPGGAEVLVVELGRETERELVVVTTPEGVMLAAVH